MPNHIHGFARIGVDGRVVLGFSPDAPIFKQLANDAPTLELEPDYMGYNVVGYSVVYKAGDHGFLWYPHEKEQAERSRRSFGDSYEVLALRIKQ